jgi:glycosyltransferase involved in cell wall biosynthesis
VDPVVSVIVPTFNRPDMLRRALQSVLDQSFKRFEILVANDAGEGVESIVQHMNTAQQITYVRHDRNRGLAATRNTALRLARGKYIAYLDDDDMYYPQHLETLVGVLEKQGCEAAYTDAQRVHHRQDEGRWVEIHRDVPFSCDFDNDRILIGNFIPVLCVMHEKRCLEQAGLFDESLTTHEDWDLWIRLSRRFKFAHIRQVTCEFSWRTDGSTMTSQNMADFLRTLDVIYDRYRKYTSGKPPLIAAQTENRQSLAARIQTQGREQRLQVQQEIARIAERVNRYIRMGKQELASRIMEKELKRFKAADVDRSLFVATRGGK